MAYPSRADLVAASDVPELLAAPEAKQDEYFMLARRGVEGVTGQKFVQWTGARILDGRGGRELYLPERLDTLTGIAVLGTTIDLTDVQIADDGKRLVFVPMNTSYAVMAMRDTWADSRTFRMGLRTVTVTGVWGWSEAPDELATAMRWDMEDQARADQNALAGTIAAYRRLGVNEIAQGNLRATIGPAAPVLSARAASLLADYVWWGEGGYVV